MAGIKRNIIFFHIFTLFFLFCTGAAAQQVGAMGNRLSKDSILIGDQVVWTMDVDVPESGSLLVQPYSEILQGDTTGTKIELLSDFMLDTLSSGKGVRKIAAKLLITAFDSGSYKLPEPLFIIESSGYSDTLQFVTPVLYVNTIQVDTTGFVPMDIKGQMNYPVTFDEVAAWGGAGIALLIIIYLIYRYIKYRRENRDFFGRPIVKDPPHIIALRELDRLRAEKLWQSGKEKLFYTGVTDTLRAYIEGRFGVSAMEKTSAEIMQSLSDKEIEKRSYQELDELFKLADLVKFAKFVPDVNSNEDTIPKAVRFVNSTFMQELENEKEGK